MRALGSGVVPTVAGSANCANSPARCAAARATSARRSNGNGYDGASRCRGGVRQHKRLSPAESHDVGKRSIMAADTTLRDLIAGIETVRKTLGDEARMPAIEKLAQRGKLSARKRIASLVDAGSFAEIGALVAAE